MGGLFSLYLKVWFNPRVTDGSLVQGAQRVWNGTQEAPFQYRFVVPDLIVGLSRLFGTGIGPTAKAVDAVNLALGAVLLDRLLRRLGLRRVDAARGPLRRIPRGGPAVVGEVRDPARLAVMALATTVLVGDHRRRPALLLASALVLCGMRTDLVLALGVALLARWRWADRRRIDLQLGLAIGALGVARDGRARPGIPRRPLPGRHRRDPADPQREPGDLAHRAGLPRSRRPALRPVPRRPPHAGCTVPRTGPCW